MRGGKPGTKSGKTRQNPGKTRQNPGTDGTFSGFSSVGSPGSVLRRTPASLPILSRRARKPENVPSVPGFTQSRTCPGTPENRNTIPAHSPYASRWRRWTHKFRTRDLSSARRPAPHWARRPAEAGGTRRAWFGKDRGRTIAGGERPAGEGEYRR